MILSQKNLLVLGDVLDSFALPVTKCVEVTCLAEVCALQVFLNGI